MHILDEISDKVLDNVIIYLTQTEAKELMDGLNELMKKPLLNHVHISSEDFQRELTFCIYDIKNLNGFSERSKKVIKENR